MELRVCSTSLFVACCEALLGEKLQGIIRCPASAHERADNIQIILRELAHTVLQTDLSHISSMGVVSGDPVDVRNLLEILSALLSTDDQSRLTGITYYYIRMFTYTRSGLQCPAAKPLKDIHLHLLYMQGLSRHLMKIRFQLFTKNHGHPAICSQMLLNSFLTAMQMLGASRHLPRRLMASARTPGVRITPWLLPLLSLLFLSGPSSGQQHLTLSADPHHGMKTKTAYAVTACTALLALTTAAVVPMVQKLTPVLLPMLTVTITLLRPENSSNRARRLLVKLGVASASSQQRGKAAGLL